MPDSSPTTCAREDRLADVLREYFESVDAGARSDWRGLIPRYPDLAEDIEEFFRNHENLRCWTTPEKVDDSCATPTQVGSFSTRWILSLPYRMGDYELLEEIGRGGMGVIYRAIQQSLNRTVAVKMVQGWATPEHVSRFVEEAKAAASLNHPNIVPIFDIGQHEGHLYFSMQYIAGTDLSKRRTDLGGNFPAIARLVAIVARAVHHAHLRGILHRDLKPGNILLDESKHKVERENTDLSSATTNHPTIIAHPMALVPYITDFGLAKRVSSLHARDALTQSGAVVGTPNYMAPEQAAGRKDLTMAVDTYALGAIFYELLTGRKPFDSESVMETLMRVQFEDPASLCKLNPKVPRDLETICLKCIDKDPARRYQTAEAFAEDLERWLAGEPITARPGTQLHRIWKWARRRPAVAVLLALVFLLSTVGAFAVFASWRESVLQRGLAEERAETAAEQRAQAEKSRLDLVRSLYFHQMALADRECLEYRPTEALRILAKLPHEHHGWEWNYVQRLAAGSLSTLRLDGKEPEIFAVHPTRPLFAVPGPGNTIVLASLNDGKTLETLQPVNGRINGLAFSADGSALAVCAGKSIRVWDLAKKSYVFFHGVPDSIQCLALSADASKLAVGTNKDIRYWEHWAREPRPIVLDKSALSLAFSPQGAELLSGSSSGVKVWRKQDAVLELEHVGSKQSVAVAWAPDGNQFAYTHDEQVEVHDFGKKTRLHSMTSRLNSFATLAWSPDGKQIVAGSHGPLVQVWNAASGREERVLAGHTRSITSLGFCDAGRRLATFSAGRTVKIWDPRRDPGRVRFVGNAKSVSGIAFLPDEMHLLIGVDGRLVLWNHKEVRSVKDLAMGEQMLGFTVLGDGRTVIALDSTSRVLRLDLNEDKPQAVPQAGFGQPMTLAAEPGGTQVVFGYLDGRICVWDSSRSEIVRTFQGHPDLVLDLAYAPNGRLLASLGVDDTVRLWDTTTWAMAGRLPGDKTVFKAIAFHPDSSRLATSDYQKNLRVWNLSRMPEIREVFLIEDSFSTCNGLAFSPDGKRLVSGHADSTVRLWDAVTGQGVLTLRGHRERVDFVTFDREGRFLASVDAKGTVVVWNGAE